MKKIEVNAALTERYQTTVPEPVRRALNLQKRDRINFQILPSGAVLLAKAEPGDLTDPAIGAFLNFLEQDLVSNPSSLSLLTLQHVKELQALAKGIQFDLDEPLSPEDD
jgi:antitoxin PrlF